MRQHKKLLMILIALLFTAVGGAWAEDTFYLVLDESGKSATMMYGETDTGIKFMPEKGYTIDGVKRYLDIDLIETVTIDKSCKKHSRDDISFLFQGFASLKTINNMENLKTEGVKDMTGMFSGCRMMEKLDLSSFNTASVTHMTAMFEYCTNLRCIYVGDGWSTTAVTHAIDMFDHCISLPDYDENNYGIEMAKLTVDGGYLTYKAYGNIAVDWNATTKTATIAHMPASDVLMLVDYYPAMLTIGNTEGGTVELVIDDTLPEGFETDDEGNIYIAEGTEFTVKAVAEEGYYLKKWNLNGDITDAELNMTMGGEDLTISATFEPWPTLTLAAEGNGTVEANDTKYNDVIADDFEAYTAGNKLATSAIAAGKSYWTTWSNAPGGNEDGTVQNLEGTNCAKMVYNNDQVLMLGNVNEGVWEYSFDVYVPENSYGYFTLMHELYGSITVTAMECYLNATDNGKGTTTIAPGHGTLHANGLAVADLPCAVNEWMHITVVIDIDNDIAQLYYNGALKHEWPWSRDYIGQSDRGSKISAANFCNYTTGNVFYIDNVAFREIVKPGSRDIKATETAGQYKVKPGTEVILKAVADENHHLTSWSNEAAVNDEATQTFTMGEADLSITATFAENLYDLTFNAANTNTIKAEKATVTVDDAAAAITHNDDGSKSIIEGLKKGSTVTLTAANGYKFRSVKATANGGESMTSAGAGIAIGDVFMFGSYVDFGSNTVKVRFFSGSNSDYTVGMSLKQSLTYGGYQSGKHKLGLERENLTIFLYIVDSNSAQPWGIKIIDGDGSEGNPFVLSAIYEWPAGHSEELIVGDDGASFEIPGKDITVDYEVVRDLTDKVDLNLYYNGTAVTRARIVKDNEGHYQLMDGSQFVAIDILDPQNPVRLTNGEVNYSLKKKQGNEYVVNDLVPGIWRIEATANDGEPYDGTVYSEDITLFAGYEVEVPAGEYVTYYKEENLCLDDREAQLYTITEVGEGTATATELTVASAYTPLLVKNNGSTTRMILLIPTETSGDAVTPAGEFKGTLEPATIAASNSTQWNYAFNGKAFVWVKNAIDIGANKAWLEISPSNARTIRIVFDNTTRIDETTISDALDGDYYDLNGRKLNAVPTRKGIYIKNGRKVVVR